MNVLAGSAACTSFNKVAGNGYRGPPDLTYSNHSSRGNFLFPCDRKYQLMRFWKTRSRR